MPFIPNTPESLLLQSDSKNGADTCRGLTSNGQPCRRPISKSPHSSPGPSPQRGQSSEAFCWQHREQAQAQASTHNTPTPSPQRKHKTVKERNSVDTLVDRLGLLEVEQNTGRKPRQSRTHRQHTHAEKPTNEVPEATNPNPTNGPPQKERSSLLGLCCCIGEGDEAEVSVRPAKNGRRPSNTAQIPPQKPLKEKADRPHITRDPSSRTGEFVSLIPAATPPQTAALLLAELAKPISESDTTGYIYMFWLTPESLPADAPSETASHLLEPPSRPVNRQRRTSDVLNTFAAATPDTSSKKTMLLKIGRAQNVQKRLNEWTRQCGYNVSLIRYYPYHSSTPSANNADQPPKTPHKVPNVNKVERLIHIEIASKRLKGDGKCAACGREHREWFEVDASREGVKEVDAVIRRWVEWSEREVQR
ncbi:hypothetical protein HYALB_00001543 [Hymenoscyphus albidus]|uniref:Bacteriophage T5 Orf172 DNA-binding domain-containing protein n=1 Tax=Hymenoscyphus albidus TaxID=595503 RepID=A0A9N9LBI6_9HELO|nr:hypothetical protein HYALB_00001543 [Hymenoscyphus albidus]